MILHTFPNHSHSILILTHSHFSHHSPQKIKSDRHKPCICSAPQRRCLYCSACKQGLCLDVLYINRFSCAVFDFRFLGMCLYACLACVASARPARLYAVGLCVCTDDTIMICLLSIPLSCPVVAPLIPCTLCTQGPHKVVYTGHGVKCKAGSIWACAVATDRGLCRALAGSLPVRSVSGSVYVVRIVAVCGNGCKAKEKPPRMGRRTVMIFQRLQISACRGRVRCSIPFQR